MLAWNSQIVDQDAAIFRNSRHETREHVGGELSDQHAASKEATVTAGQILHDRSLEPGTIGERISSSFCISARKAS
jgi:hypothetical protein